MKEEFPKESFIARLEDMCRLTVRRRKPVFSSFLNDREQYEAELFLSSRSDVTAEFWGGDDACTRKMLRVCGEDCFGRISSRPSLILFRSKTFIIPQDGGM